MTLALGVLKQLAHPVGLVSTQRLRVLMIMAIALISRASQAKPPFFSKLLLIPVYLPVNVNMEILDSTVLPKDWRTHAGRETLQNLGGEWLRQSRSCVLAVPSAVMQAELNFLINPLHPDFKRISRGEPETLNTDIRLR